MNAFAYMLDTFRTNAHSVVKEIKLEIRPFDFIWQLGMLLVNAHVTCCLTNTVGLQQTVITKLRKNFKVAESPKAADVSMQEASDRYWCHICIEEIRGQEKCKENKDKLAKIQMSCKDCNNVVWKKHLNISAENVGKSKTEQTENNGELFQELQKQSPKCVLLKRCSLFLKNTSGRLLLEIPWGIASGKMVKWLKGNGEHFLIFQNSPPVVFF